MQATLHGGRRRDERLFGEYAPRLDAHLDPAAIWPLTYDFVFPPPLTPALTQPAHCLRIPAPPFTLLRSLRHPRHTQQAYFHTLPEYSLSIAAEGPLSGFSVPLHQLPAPALPNLSGKEVPQRGHVHLSSSFTSFITCVAKSMSATMVRDRSVQVRGRRSDSAGRPHHREANTMRRHRNPRCSSPHCPRQQRAASSSRMRRASRALWQLHLVSRQIAIPCRRHPVRRRRRAGSGCSPRCAI